MRWYDPVAYKFTFTEYSADMEHGQCIAAFRELLAGIRDILIGYHEQIPDGMAIETNLTQGHPFTLDNMAQSFTEKLDQLIMDDDQWRFINRVFMFERRLSRKPYVPEWAHGKRDMTPEWREKISVLYDKKVPTKEKNSLLRELITCPNPSLEGIYLPETAVRDLGISVHFSHQGVHPENIASWMHNNPGCFTGGPIYYNHIEIVVSRYILSGMGVSFPFQNTWCRLLKHLCSMRPFSMGSVLMDCCAYSNGALGQSFIYDDSLTRCIPGIAWAMGLTGQQSALLRETEAAEPMSIEDLKAAGSFAACDALGANGLWLQLSDDIHDVSRERLQRAGKLFEKAFLFRPYRHMWWVNETPPSMRLHLCDDIAIDQHGGYRIGCAEQTRPHIFG